MSVLLRLPSELCYNIISEWITESHFYLTILLMDAAVKSNRCLRLLLLNHFRFSQFVNENFRNTIDFSWEEGYRCDSFSYNQDDVINIVEGVHPIFKRLTTGQVIDTCVALFAKFVNSCARVDEIDMYEHNLLNELSEDILSKLTFMTLNYEYSIIKLDPGFDRVKQYCSQLQSFHAIGYKTWAKSEAIQVMNGIVANNPNLQSIKMYSSSDILNILSNGNFTKLQHVLLFMKEADNVSNIFKILQLNPKLTTFCIANNYDAVFSYKIAENNVDVEWSVHSLNGNLLSEIIDFAATRTTYIQTENISVSVSMFQTALKKLENLQTLKILNRFSNCNWAEIVNCFPASLHTLTVKGLTASDIMSTLTNCKTLIECQFNESAEDPSIVPELSSIMSEYPKLSSSTLFSVSFKNGGYIAYRNGTLACYDKDRYVAAGDNTLKLK